MEAKDVRTIAVIGAGFMGCGIAQVFASKNYNVHLYNRTHPDDADFFAKRMDSIRATLSTMASKGVGLKSEIEPTILQPVWMRQLRILNLLSKMLLKTWS